MKIKGTVKKIMLSACVAAAVLAADSMAVGAADLTSAQTQTMTPEQLAQELARQEEIARAAQAARDQAATDEARLAAEAKAQEQEASDLYLKWGANAGTYNYTQNVADYLNGTSQSSAASTNTLSAATAAANIVNVDKVNASALGIKTVDLIIFAGQSNMSGAGGNAKQAPAVAATAGLEFRSASDPTGLYPITEPFGIREGGYVGESPVVKHGSLVSSFINTYYAKTGIPVVAVSASRGGTNSAFWASQGARSDLLSKYTKAKNWLISKGFNIRHKYLVFLQGESDSNGLVTSEQYTANLNAAFSSLFNSGLEQVFIITPGYAQGGFINYDAIVATQEAMCVNSNRYTLASEKLRTFPATSAYMSDEVHYNQKALNLVGADAAVRVAMGY